MAQIRSVIRRRSVILPLILTNIIIFFIQSLSSDFTANFLLAPNQVFQRPWIIITSMFLHGGVNHIFYNMYGLYMFGSLLERKITSEKVLSIYFIAGIAASVGHIIFSKFLYGSASPALGASGALMGVIGALIILMPDLRLLFFFLIPMPLWVAGIIWTMIDVFGVFFPSGIANFAHLTGLLVGTLYGLYIKNKSKKYYSGDFSKKRHLNTSDLEGFLKQGRL